jgi:hypothetical protein
MMSKTIYVVTQGSYSDYGIRAVFDDKALAQKFIEAFGSQSYDQMEIEEWELNPCAPALRKGHVPYFLRMNREGEAVEVRAEASAYGFGDGGRIGFDVNGNMYISLFAKNPQHATKIANEHRAQLIADGKWHGDIQPASASSGDNRTDA